MDPIPGMDSAEERNFFVVLEIVSRFTGRPAWCLVTLLTELAWIQG